MKEHCIHTVPGKQLLPCPGCPHNHRGHHAVNVYVLLLEAQSAFNMVVIEHAIRSAYLAGTQGEWLVYLDHRLRNRKTFIKWDKEILGPIRDTIGLEQGGCANERFYRLVNNEQIKIAQDSELGFQLDLAMRPVTRGNVSALERADNVALVSTSLGSLQALLQLRVVTSTDFQCSAPNSVHYLKVLLFCTDF